VISDHSSDFDLAVEDSLSGEVDCRGIDRLPCDIVADLDPSRNTVRMMMCRRNTSAGKVKGSIQDITENAR
jgi:hypothetical protein